MTEKKPESITLKWGNKTVTLPIALALSLLPTGGLVALQSNGMMVPKAEAACVDTVCRTQTENIRIDLERHEADDSKAKDELSRNLRELREGQQKTMELLVQIAKDVR